MSGIVNKIKEAVHPDKSHHGAPEGTHGPHESRAANAMDPRVDSDRDNSRTMGTGRTAGQGEYGSSTTTGYGSSTTGTGYGTGSAPEGTHGPHGSRVANAMDPRVDSDRDNSRTVGTGRTAGHGEYGSSTSGYGTGSTAEGVHGPHSSRVANAMDPRVDSDRDNSRTVGTGTSGIGSTGTSTFGSTGTSGYGQTGTSGIGSTGTSGFGSTGTSGGYSSTGAGSGATGMTGTHGAPAGTYGPHSSRMANAADPRVDSDRDGRGALGSSGGPGLAPNTAGPHKSDMANKLDPRVDSDLDHSRTVGGNKTYQQ